ncbi:MAG: hypothetical protein LBH43_01670 [Treponema sp.]|jgi:hypothetical protein|nr:hypothetical protein [Treponema sp.]
MKLMCSYFGCHVEDTPVSRECACTKCNFLGDHGHDKCVSFMAQARRSVWFVLSAEKKCNACKEVGKMGSTCGVNTQVEIQHGIAGKESGALLLEGAQ